nr:MAG TPA: hypothetical protein [Caudoviricetes sp.]
MSFFGCFFLVVVQPRFHGGQIHRWGYNHIVVLCIYDAVRIRAPVAEHFQLEAACPFPQGFKVFFFVHVHDVTSIQLLACSFHSCNLLVCQLVELVFQPCNIAHSSTQERIIPRRSFPQEHDLIACVAAVNIICFVAFLKPFCKNRQQVVNVLYSSGQLPIIYIIQAHTVKPPYRMPLNHITAAPRKQTRANGPTTEK